MMYGNPFGYNRTAGGDRRGNDGTSLDSHREGKLPAILDFKRSPIDVQFRQQQRGQYSNNSIPSPTLGASVSLNDSVVPLLNDHNQNELHDSFSQSRMAALDEVDLELPLVQNQNEAPSKVPSTASVPMSFPQKLMKILDDERNAEIVSWLPHGRAFLIFQKKRFETELMPTLFKQSKFTSFTRKLNRWGFQRVRKGPEAGAYYHKYFKRGQPRLSMQMCCQKVPNEQEDTKPDPGDGLPSPDPSMRRKMGSGHQQHGQLSGIPDLSLQRGLMQQQAMSPMSKAVEPTMSSQFLNATARRQQILNSIALAQKEMESLKAAAASHGISDDQFNPFAEPPSMPIMKQMNNTEVQMLALKRQKALLMQQQKQQMQLQQQQQQLSNTSNNSMVPFNDDGEGSIGGGMDVFDDSNSVAYLAAQNAMMRRKMMEQNALMRKTMAELYRNQQKLLQKAAATGNRSPAPSMNNMGSMGGSMFGGGGGGSMDNYRPMSGASQRNMLSQHQQQQQGASSAFGLYDITANLRSKSPNDETEMMNRMQMLQAQLCPEDREYDLAMGLGPTGTRRAHAA